MQSKTSLTLPERLLAEPTFPGHALEAAQRLTDVARQMRIYAKSFEEEGFPNCGNTMRSLAYDLDGKEMPA